MTVKVLPSVLARTPAQLRTQWSLATEFGRVVHLDIADGTLVPSRTVGPKNLEQLDPRQPVEVHAMTRRPDRWLQTMLRLRLRRVILHIELGSALRPYIALFRSHRIPVGLAINPETSIVKLQPWRGLINGIQVMGVHPGHLGAAWQPQTIKRLKQLHARYPRLALSCDGGMTPATIPDAVRAGASTVIVGSYFQRHDDPQAAWDAIRAASRGRKG